MRMRSRPTWMTPELRRYGLTLNLIGLVCCAAGSALLWFGIEATFQSRRSSLETTLQEQHQLAAQMPDLQNRLKSLQQEEERLQEQLTASRSRIPRSADEVSFLEQIAHHAETCGVHIREFVPGATQRFGQHLRTEIQLTSTTDYQGFCRFLFAIRGMERLFDIELCTLKSSDPTVDQQILTVTFSIFHEAPSALAAADAEVPQ